MDVFWMICTESMMYFLSRLLWSQCKNILYTLLLLYKSITANYTKPVDRRKTWTLKGLLSRMSLADEWDGPCLDGQNRLLTMFIGKHVLHMPASLKALERGKAASQLNSAENQVSLIEELHRSQLYPFAWNLVPFTNKTHHWNLCCPFEVFW